MKNVLTPRVPAARLLRPRSSATTHVPAGSASGRRGGFNFRPPGRVHHPDEPDCTAVNSTLKSQTMLLAFMYIMPLLVNNLVKTALTV